MSIPTFAIIVMIDIVNSTKFIEKVGDKKASKVFRLYDRIFRGLLIKYNGIEIDKTDGALLLFKTMREAVKYIREYHRLVETHTGLKSRAGIHCGTVMMHSNSSIWVSRGAKPIEIEGLEKVLCARIMNLAEGGQTLATKRASQIILSFRLVYIAYIGEYKLKGVLKPVPIYSIGDNRKRLKKVPKGNDKAKLYKKAPLPLNRKLLKWAFILTYPFTFLYALEFYLIIFELCHYIGYLKFSVSSLLNSVHEAQDFLLKLLWLK